MVTEMRKIKYFDNELSVEEYIKIQLVRNDGIRSLVYRKDLIEECASRNIQTKATSTKEQLVELLVSNGVTYKELANRYKIGVTSKAYQDMFGITHNQVKKLEKKKVIDVVGQYEFRAYGRNLKAPLYDIYQFASIPEEVIKNI
ncbi:hypothetical protein [uncultured Eubacterium sp.]|uniref:hypothetical protein n=1 Tax=uncultured Eubacterium sp. TaxID=165185 RepID=UPI00267117A4|nr:hypothetical protein [uncultured Eubacterium sp.]